MITPSQAGYADVNGLSLYYEVYGLGYPLVLIHGGGSTIDTSFGRIIPLLAKNRQLIALELQAHGRTADRDTPLSFQQDAADVAALLQRLGIRKADMLGFSNGGQTTIEMALRYPDMLNRIILASAFTRRDAISAEFWTVFNQATIDLLPSALKDGFLTVNNNHAALQRMFERDVERMKNFTGWPDDVIASIKTPTLIINATQDVAPVEHAVLMHRLIAGSELAIFPGGHGDYLGTIETMKNGSWPIFNAVPLIEQFLTPTQS